MQVFSLTYFSVEPQWPDKCSFVYISRDAWKAAPKSLLLNHYTADQKLTHVQISQTSTRACYDYVECSQELRFLQSSHVGRNLSDIAYNFIVAGDGRTYEGRGWDYKPGLLPDDIGNKTFTVGFLGEMRVDENTKWIFCSYKSFNLKKYL